MLLRFLILLIIIYLLSKYHVINFKYFFYSATFFSTVLALDIIYQYYFLYDIFGLESNYPKFRNSGFFGKDEPVAGGFIARFSFFSIFLIYLLTIKKNLKNLLLTSLIIYVSLMGILFSGDKMPGILFLMGLFTIFIFLSELRKPIFLSLVIFALSFILVINSNKMMKTKYLSFYAYAKDISVNIYKNFEKEKKVIKAKNLDEQSNYENFLDKVIQSQLEYMPRVNHHKNLFLTAIETWKMNKIFGNGLKSFRKDCILMIESRFKYKGDYQKLIKNNRSCSNHPHNYYLEVLTEAGLIGLCFMFLFFFMLLIFSFNFLIKNKKKFNERHFILLAALINLILEFFPLRSSGSFFSTQNATYIVIMLSIIVSYKNSQTA